LSLCLTKHHAMKTYWGSGGIAPRILDLKADFSEIRKRIKLLLNQATKAKPTVEIINKLIYSSDVQCLYDSSSTTDVTYKGVTKSFRTNRLERSAVVSLFCESV
jgi:hypothetical protein